VFFYSDEGNEPVHVHIRKAGGFAKFWVEPIELEFAKGMKVKDIARAEELVREHSALILEKWNEARDR
jgi:hypothetical protein